MLYHTVILVYHSVPFDKETTSDIVLLNNINVGCRLQKRTKLQIRPFCLFEFVTDIHVPAYLLTESKVLLTVPAL
jgi:hypothetical protein